MRSGLSGKKVLVTRPKQDASRLVEQLELRGAAPILLPTTEISEPKDLESFDCALRRLSEFDWVVFTSINGVRSVAERMKQLELDPNLMRSRRIAVVGPSTGREVSKYWKEPDAMPQIFISDEIANVIPDLTGARVLMPRGNLARSELSQTMAAKGACVLDVTAYEVMRPMEVGLVDAGDTPDAITIMSGESARATVARLRDSGLERWLSEVPIACIGPVTAASVVSEGYVPAVVARDHTIRGLINALEVMFEGESPLA